MASKREVFTELNDRVVNFMSRFKYLETCLDSLCKKLGKTAASGESFDEFLKIYSMTSSMYIKSLDALNNLICRFPEELRPEELELIENYRNCPESIKLIIRAKTEELANAE